MISEPKCEVASMESADSDSLWAALQAQSKRIHKQDEQCSYIRQKLREMTERQEKTMDRSVDRSVSDVAMAVPTVSSRPLQAGTFFRELQ